MNDQSDAQLLSAWANTRSEPAFAELARRHLDLVHSAARRMVCDPHLAEDVTQRAFVALAKNATQITDCRVLAGWLHRTAQNIAAETVRSDVRRRTREQEAATMNTLLAESGAGDSPAWEHVAPHLDAALGELSEPDRDAVLLRYFERKTAREMAQILGTSEDAAQRRVSRAVERLREFFAKRGVTVGASGLVVVISANAVQAAPVGLAVTITTAAVLAGATIATTVTATATKAIAMTMLQKTIIGAALAAAVGTGIYEARQASTLRTQVEAMKQQQAPLTEQIQELSQAFNKATNQVAALREVNERLNRNTSELLRLRGQIALLRAESRASKPPASTNSTETTAKLWTDRANKLKQYLEQNPNEKIPEFQFLTDREWLVVVADNWEETPGITREHRALDHLRSQAETLFSYRIQPALRKYTSENNGQFPTHLSQLVTYCEPVVADLLLQLYEIRKTDVFPPDYRKGYEIKSDWMITRKNGVNPNSPSRLAIFSDGNAYWQTHWLKVDVNKSQQAQQLSAP